MSWWAVAGLVLVGGTVAVLVIWALRSARRFFQERPPLAGAVGAVCFVIGLVLLFLGWLTGSGEDYYLLPTGAVVIGAGLLMDLVRPQRFPEGLESPPAPRLDRIIRFIPTFEQAGFSYGRWESKDGKFPWFAYAPEVMEFQQVLDEDGWIEGFDWGAWQQQAEEYFLSPERLGQASVATLRKLLTLHVRKERFCEGHLAAMFEEGHILAILHRVAVLASGEATEP
jgi:hypothetical protein